MKTIVLALDLQSNSPWEFAARIPKTENPTSNADAQWENVMPERNGLFPGLNVWLLLEIWVGYVSVFLTKQLIYAAQRVFFSS